MIHSSSNRTTPTGENITKLVRQRYKPAPKQVYSNEKVQCRTEVTHQKIKPEDYWTTNYKRRQGNLHKGFYSSSKEPYKPVGGQLILDPCELVLSALPGTVDKKISRRRRGTIFETKTVDTYPKRKEKIEFDKDSFTSQDLVDTAPTAGYNDIKKLIKESNQRLISVRAGNWYEDHVKAVEESRNTELEAGQPEDTGMVLKSISLLCLHAQTDKSSKQASSELDSTKSSRNSSERVSIAEVIKTPSPVRRDRVGNGRSTLKAPLVKENKISLQQVGTGLASVAKRKQRQFRDHHLFLKSIFNILRALHNLKVRDIRSKVPLSREVVERLQREQFKEEDYSRGTYISHMHGRQRGGNTYRSGYNSRRTSLSEDPSELGDLLQEDFLSKRTQFQQKTTKDFFLNPRQDTQRSRRLSVASYNQGGFNSRHTSVAESFGENADFMFDDAALKKPAASHQRTKDQSKYMKARSTGDRSAPTTFSSVAKKTPVAEQMFKSFGANKSRRKSRNASNIATSDRSTLETWEDLLNVQPEPYKEEKGGGNMCFQIGVISKFMRWYRKVENDSPEKRRASIVPQHGASPGNLPGITDKSQLSHLHEIHEKGLAADKSEKGDKESNYAQPRPGSGQQTSERVKKLPIWQQVAQEKSTVFQDKTKATPNPDTSVQRCRLNLNKLKKSVQKEYTATLEKMVRERLANYRLKLSFLNSDEHSLFFEEQMNRLQDVKGKGKVNLENFDFQPSKWYEELTEKTISMIYNYQQPEIIDTLNKLQIYAHMDNKTLSYSKAKLCLLTMSLPAYDICQIYTQKALKFIFENILLGQEAQFYEWLNLRKMPIVVISDPNSRSESPQRDFVSPTKDK